MSASVIKKDIPDNAENIVVFVHGFGARWDARGMFVDIKDNLPKGWGAVLFDLYRVEGADVYVESIKYQVDKLKEVIAETKQDNPNVKIHIIAHSKGCIITSLANPEITGKIILLAPPESFGTRLQEYFERYPGVEKTDTEIIVPRKDGTQTHIPLAYFDESQKIDAQEVMKALSATHPFTLLQTTIDEVIGKTTYDQLQNIKNIQITQINSDHNFTGASRAELISHIKEILK